MEIVNVMERSYKRSSLYERNKDDGKLRQGDKRLGRPERSAPYVVRDGMIMAIDKMHLCLMYQRSAEVLRVRKYI